MQTRAETFETNYKQITTKEMQEIFVDGSADDCIPDSVKTDLDEVAETKIEDLDKKTKNYTDIIKLQYIKNHIPYEISRMQLKGQLEQIASAA